MGEFSQRLNESLTRHDLFFQIFIWVYLTYAILHMLTQLNFGCYLFFFFTGIFAAIYIFYFHDIMLQDYMK